MDSWLWPFVLRLVLIQEYVHVHLDLSIYVYYKVSGDINLGPEKLTVNIHAYC